jgi:hypothetical protein
MFRKGLRLKGYRQAGPPGPHPEGRRQGAAPGYTDHAGSGDAGACQSGPGSVRGRRAVASLPRRAKFMTYEPHKLGVGVGATSSPTTSAPSRYAEDPAGASGGGQWLLGARGAERAHQHLVRSYTQASDGSLTARLSLWLFTGLFGVHPNTRKRIRWLGRVASVPGFELSSVDQEAG